VKFLADECVDTQLVEFLRAKGHDVFYVMEAMRGATDDVILAKAYQDQRILLTEDKDFGELVFRLRKPAICVILLRFNLDAELQKIHRLEALLNDNSTNFVGTFIVIDQEKHRIRPLLI